MNCRTAAELMPWDSGELRGRTFDCAWLAREVESAGSLTDEDRTRILCDLLDAAAAIEATKSEGQREREDQVRRELERPGRDRYRALAERLG